MKLNDELRSALFDRAQHGIEPQDPQRSDLIEIRALDHLGRFTGYGIYCLVRNGYKGRMPKHFPNVRRPMPKNIKGVQR